jgi:hypothetical protein
MGCHFLDLPFWALHLDAPLTIEAEGPAVSLEAAPSWMVSKWTFGARGELPPVEVTWYDGNVRPDLPEEVNRPEAEHGIVFVGSEGMISATYHTHELFPKEKFADLKYPEPTITGLGRREGWLAACKSDDPAMRNYAGNEPLNSFDHSGPLTEMVLLGTVAYRVGKKIEWDAENLRVTNSPEANLLIERQNRKGWEL